jgi:hypothetical protein
MVRVRLERMRFMVQTCGTGRYSTSPHDHTNNFPRFHGKQQCLGCRRHPQGTGGGTRGNTQVHVYWRWFAYRLLRRSSHLTLDTVEGCCGRTSCCTRPDRAAGVSDLRSQRSSPSLKVHKRVLVYSLAGSHWLRVEKTGRRTVWSNKAPGDR